ncbi:hypothetical protein A4X13_0g5667 [Tilletia indica]|uniref:Uncharacterized protein n=1 Tax=Tilletia indica TaxID=43049 RepID=A0A177T753_9BASI|nr:hypothetical protein A4X13_0g5667 [Tilletia indica]
MNLVRRQLAPAIITSRGWEQGGQVQEDDANTEERNILHLAITSYLFGVESQGKSAIGGSCAWSDGGCSESEDYSFLKGGL